jgi:hypothetical protein
MCKSCGYESKQPIGYSYMDQILSDVNLDYADYRLFLCKGESTFVHVDIHNKEFEGKCPHDDSELIEIREIPPTKCPHCSQDLITEVSEPLDRAVGQGKP